MYCHKVTFLYTVFGLSEPEEKAYNGRINHILYIFFIPVPYGNHGCACGDVNNAFLYVIDNDGIDTWSTYPFKSRVSGQC